MPRRSRPRARLALLTLLVATGCATPDERPDQPSPGRLAGAARGWNVVLISVDTLRADHLNAYGYSVRETSPWIDKLMANGVRFDRAQATRSHTWPSLASVLTGLYRRSHGVTTNGYRLVDALELLPEVLQEAGYETGAFLGSMCWGANHQGWDRRDCKKDPFIGKEARQWLDRRDPKRPWFLWTHWFGAHSPYQMGDR